MAALNPNFGLKITPDMRALLEPDAERDPVAAQFILQHAEHHISEAERADPIGDEAYSPVPGIVHRYPDRVLLKLLHSCAVHCRFCFRREQINEAPPLDDEALANAFAYLREHKEIWEVILTGGDPLLLAPRRLRDIMQRFEDIPHVKIIRIHTRIPVVDPQRITPELIESLASGKTLYVLLHCNHARELTAAARQACAALIDHGIPMLSQSVLLRGVNDREEDLVGLMRAFVETRIMPHYLHHPDLARGTAHFRVPIAEGQSLLRKLHGRISGLCQPRYVLDIPGGAGKSPLGPVYAVTDGDSWIIEDFRGHRHRYRDDVPQEE